jgi:ribosomal protein S18 acetylase RimI-like enzyme
VINANLSLRLMRPEDAATVSKMIKWFAEGFGDKAKVREHDLLKYCFGRKQLSTVLLAFAEKKPIGFAITRDWMNFYLGIKFRHIDSIFIESTHRHAGVASAMIKFIAQKAANVGCHSLSLDVGKNNKIATSLYKKLGFEKRPDTSAHYRLSNSNFLHLAGRKGGPK